MSTPLCEKCQSEIFIAGKTLCVACAHAEFDETYEEVYLLRLIERLEKAERELAEAEKIFQAQESALGKLVGTVVLSDNDEQSFLLSAEEFGRVESAFVSAVQWLERRKAAK